MKKLSLILALFIFAGAFVSCGDSGVKESETTAPIETEESAVANSTSEEYVLTEEMINEAVGKVYVEALSSDSEKSGEMSGGKKLPVYMSLESVKKLTKDNYVPYWDEFGDHQLKVFESIEAMVEELPDKCIMEHRPSWIRNAPYAIKQYVIMDPKAVPEGDNEELVLLLEYLYYEARAERLNMDFDYAVYYEQDMEALRDKYSGMDKILLNGWLEWSYIDIKTGVVEEIELFENSTEIEDHYYSCIDGKMDADHGKTVSSDKDID